MKKIFYLNRYDSFEKKNVRFFSGYEQIVKYCPNYLRINENKLINKFIKILFTYFRIHKIDYIISNSSKEIICLIKCIFTKNAHVHYLYADKDAFILPILKQKLNLNWIELTGTFHWPVENIKNSTRLYKNVLCQFDKAIVLGPQLTEFYSQFITNTKFIAHGIDLNFWHSSNQFKINRFETVKNILIIGESNRNHELQIKLMAKIYQNHNDISFTVLVKSKFIIDLYSKLKNTKIIDSYIEDYELKKLYEQSFVVLLIQNDCIASNVVLEAMAMGVPIIANNVGDISYYLGYNYELFINSNINSVENTLNFLTESKRNQISYQLVQRSRLFDWKIISKQTEEFVL